MRRRLALEEVKGRSKVSLPEAVRVVGKFGPQFTDPDEAIKASHALKRGIGQLRNGGRLEHVSRRIFRYVSSLFLSASSTVSVLIVDKFQCLRRTKSVVLEALF